MAERPVFIPTKRGNKLVEAKPVQFTWNPGMSASQKKKNVNALHACAAQLGIEPVLEISSKSDVETGRRLSAFNLKGEMGGIQATVECIFQGSKVFENGGPYVDLYHVDSRSAKRDDRLRNSGRLIEFRLNGTDYPLTPPTVFYDWLYICALYPYKEWIKKLNICAGFTDIEFNPERQINCQARSCATFLALQHRDVLDQAISSFGAFKSTLERAQP